MADAARQPHVAESLRDSDSRFGETRLRVEEQPVETTLYSLSDRAPEPAERRYDERYLTLFRVGSVTIDDRRELCLIKNISAGANATQVKRGIDNAVYYLLDPQDPSGDP